MSQIIKPGEGVLFMKVGTHAKEEIRDIIDRKRQEIKDASFAMWGYGGPTCHPTRMVQPFAEQFAKKGQTIHLVMNKMKSNHYAEQVPAKHYSEDGINWKPIPSGINVLGSRYALLIRDLREADEVLNLGATRVAVGPNAGRLGSRYVQGRADKACLEVVDPERVNEPKKDIKIDLVAELLAPYAVFLRET